LIKSEGGGAGRVPNGTGSSSETFVRSLLRCGGQLSPESARGGVYGGCQLSNLQTRESRTREERGKKEGRKEGRRQQEGSKETGRRWWNGTKVCNLLWSTATVLTPIHFGFSVQAIGKNLLILIS